MFRRRIGRHHPDYQPPATDPIEDMEGRTLITLTTVEPEDDRDAIVDVLWPTNAEQGGTA